MAKMGELRIANWKLRIGKAPNPQSTIRNPQCSFGFTLMEVMVSILIIGIMASVVGPQYLRTVERSYWRATRDILQTIYSGEWVYKSNNNPPNTFVAVAPGGNWRGIYMDDPNGGAIPVTFTVAIGGSGSTFTATATRNGGPCPAASRTQTIDQDRVAGGTWPSGGCS